MIRLICVALIVGLIGFSGCGTSSAPVVKKKAALVVVSRAAQASFSLPEGGSFRIMVGLGRKLREGESFAGRVTVHLADQQTLALDIKRSETQSVKWLDGENLCAYALDWPHTLSGVSSGDSCKVYVYLASGGNNLLSIWLSYVSSEGVQRQIRLADFK